MLNDYLIGLGNKHFRIWHQKSWRPLSFLGCATHWSYFIWVCCATVLAHLSIASLCIAYHRSTPSAIDRPPALKRIQHKRLPKKKQTMALTAGIGTTTFRSRLHFVFNDDWKRIRGPFAASINRCHGGANALLGLICIGDISDPELLGAIRRCCFWRRFCKTFPHRQDAFLTKIANVVHVGKVGPAISFRKTMRALGWTCIQDGEMIRDTGLAVARYHCAKPWLVQIRALILTRVMLQLLDEATVVGSRLNKVFLQPGLLENILQMISCPSSTATF